MVLPMDIPELSLVPSQRMKWQGSYTKAYEPVDDACTRGESWPHKGNRRCITGDVPIWRHLQKYKKGRALSMGFILPQ